MIETNHSETTDISNTHRGNIESESETHIVTQEKFNEQIKTYIDSFTKKPDDLTWLIQEMPSVQWQNFAPRVGTSANFSAAGPSPISAVSENSALISGSKKFAFKAVQS